MRALISAALGGALIVSSAGFAAAQDALALVISDLNFRSQPTARSYSLGVIPGGTTIPAGPCAQGWCQAVLGGQVGYVSQRYLDFGGPPVYAAPPPPPPPIYGPPVVYGPPPYWGGWRHW